MRIVLVSDSYPPLVGGATRDTAMLARHLAGRGHQIRVVTLAQQGLTRTEVLDGIVVHRVHGLTSALSRDAFRTHHPPLDDPATRLSIRNALRGFVPEVVHTYGWLSYAALAATPSTAVGILSVRDYGNICAIRTLLQQKSGAEELCDGPGLAKCTRCALRYYHGPVRTAAAVVGLRLGRHSLLRRVGGVHYVSNFAKEAVSAHLLLGEQGPRVIERVIPSFHEPHLPDDLDDGAKRLPSEPFILFVGALRRVKGVEVLLNAYHALDHPPPLVLIGPRLEDTPPAVLKHQHVIEDATPALLQVAWRRSLFTVAPSTLAEPFGNVVHEAMSWGKPVIGTAPSGMTDMIESGVNGLLVPHGDATALRNAMAMLLRDPLARDRLGSAARLSAQRFSPDEVLPQFEDLYEAAGEFYERERAPKHRARFSPTEGHGPSRD